MYNLKNVGILFDLDGTLLDTLDDLTDAVNVTLTQFGCPVRSREEIRQFVGNGTKNLVRRSLPGKPDDPDADTVWEYYQPYYASHCQIKTRPYSGIIQALTVLSERYPIAIVSNKPDPSVNTLCAQHFPGVYARGESDDCPKKPAPDMLYKTMKEIGVDQCVYVGDSEVDVVTARNAGVPCLSVLWGFRDKEQLVECGATNFCEDPVFLVDILEEMLK